MSKKNRPLLSLRGDPNVPTTGPIAQPPAEPNAPILEQIMEATKEQNEPSTAQPIEALTVQPSEPTAKEMAAAEEANAARAAGIIRRQQEQLSAQVEADARPTVIEAAAGGIDALHAAIMANSQRPVPEYVPPPRTTRQMTQLEQELEAGRRTQLRAKEQQQLAQEARARASAAEAAKEGFTTPVYRPNNMVPDPMTGKPGPITEG
jgi:hypothetical protein